MLLKKTATTTLFSFFHFSFFLLRKRIQITKMMMNKKKEDGTNKKKDDDDDDDDVGGGLPLKFIVDGRTFVIIYIRRLYWTLCNSSHWIYPLVSPLQFSTTAHPNTNHPTKIGKKKETEKRQ